MNETEHKDRQALMAIGSFIGAVAVAALCSFDVTPWGAVGGFGVVAIWRVWRALP